MGQLKEASMSIDGVHLSEGQVMTLRVAMESFASGLVTDGLGDDLHGKYMTQAYLDRVQEMRVLMGYGE